MIIVHTSSVLSAYLQRKKEEGRCVHFVPTMGALHAGHLKLVASAADNHGLTVCSIFVNPAQFNDAADFRNYPVRLDSDIQLLESIGADVLFIPSVEEVYPSGLAGLETYDLGYLETVLEGKFRPGHFQGVCQVMIRLLRMVKPDKLFMGQKDYQQCMVVKKLIPLLGFPLELVTVPTVREPDGLAMSSRNLRLTEVERQKAGLIYQSLLGIRENLRKTGPGQAVDTARRLLEKNGFVVEYVEIADADSLLPVEQWDGSQPLVALVAAWLGKVRLIDNLTLGG